MYQSILLAYDSSAHSERAFRRAVDLARLSGAHLHILAIVEMRGGIAIAQALGVLDVQQLARESMERVIGVATLQLRAEGMRVTSQVHEGEAERQIIHYASEIGADLVVLGDSSSGMIVNWLIGSLGTRLRDRLSCGLLVVDELRSQLSLPAGSPSPPYLMNCLED